MYEPQEDSYFLKEFVKRVKGKVLDMGTGSGILAIEASKYAKSVVGVDIQSSVIKINKHKFKNIKKLKFIKNNLFKNLYQKTKISKFDYIIFNPPYLPEDKNEPEDSAIETTGGKHGWEIVERFFSDVSEHLELNGKILLLFSSQTNKQKVEEIIKDHLFEFKQLGKKSMFFETLYIYECKKTNFLKQLEKKEIKNIKRFTRGKRGLIYVGKLKTKKIAVKKQKDPNMVTVAREATWLKRLNKHKIGPNVLFSGKDYFVYEFIEGVFIPELFEKENKTKIKKVIKQVFEQCHTLDKLNIDKEEMHHPYKHVIIDKKLKPWLIDFERANYSQKPKNVTQFSQYIAAWSKTLNEKGFNIDPQELRVLSKNYKKDFQLQKILKTLSLV